MRDNLQEKLFKETLLPCVKVLVPYPIDKAYSYIVPDGLSVGQGDYVCVPLGNREVTGVVWGRANGEVDAKKLKTVVSRYDIDPMPKVHRDFIDWVAGYTLSPKGSVLKMSLSARGGLTAPKSKVGYVIAPSLVSAPTLTLPPEGGGDNNGESLPHLGGGKSEARVGANRSDLLVKSRDLRKNMTEAEKKLWHHLRKKNLGVKFRRQQFIGSYIVDFICLEKRLIIELDGGQHADQVNYDTKRTEFLESQGYRVVRYWNNEVLGNLDGVLEDIVSKLKGFTPTLTLPPKGGGDKVVENSLSEGGGGNLGVTSLPKGEDKLSPKRRKVLEVMGDGRARTASEIADLAGVSAAVVRAMADKGLLDKVSMFNPAPCLYPDYDRSAVELSEDQRIAADELCDDVSSGEFSVSLLDGVTGAGKTEIYFEAVARALKEGRQALIMLPEIALSNAFLERFKSRFGCAPALWHSNLTPSQRKLTWRGVVSGDTRVVVGARSALFLPYKNLGLIVVDEEHDPAYKQEDGVIYNARDMAVVRGSLGKFPVVLVSATPSLETMINAWEGKYRHLVLESRYGGASLPDISVVDLRADKPDRQCFLSKTMIEHVQETLDKGEQSLLFLNRRGYAPLTLCRTCGHRMECPRCTAWLVEHKRKGGLHCHHCGYNLPVPKDCPECNDADSFAACGPGVERVFEEAKANFPDARIMILASDMAESSKDIKAMLAKVIAGKVDIIIGTQIIAKGHHFPNLTFVGVVDADLGLKGGELRAAERSYQLLHQVAGRAGREHKKGRVLLQSWMPDHRIVKAMAGYDRDEFLGVEAAEREIANMPPYSRLAGIIISGRDEKEVQYIAKELGRTAPQGEQIQTLGPAPALLARLRGNYRYRLLVRADKSINIQKALKHWVGAVKTPSNVRVYIDIDPMSFL